MLTTGFSRIIVLTTNSFKDNHAYDGVFENNPAYDKFFQG